VNPFQEINNQISKTCPVPDTGSKTQRKKKKGGGRGEKGNEDSFSL
jgi:hypothetical protein